MLPNLRIWRSMALMGLVLVVSLLFGSQSAQAGCGDYVLVNGMLMNGHQSLPGQPLLAAYEHLPAKSPCANGRCSRNDRPASLPPLPKLPSVFDQWGLLISEFEASDSVTGAGWLTETSVGAPIHRPGDLLRPPRIDGASARG